MNSTNVFNFLTGKGQVATLLRQKDWSATPIGDVSEWSSSLRTSINTCLNSRFPVLIWWGPEAIMFYNDAYSVLIGTKHPAALGSAGAQVWPKTWALIRPLIHAVLRKGEAKWSENQLFILNRNPDNREEIFYFTVSYIPIYNEAGSIVGVFSAVTETTDSILAEQKILAHSDHLEQLNLNLEQQVIARTQSQQLTLDRLVLSQQELLRALSVERELTELKGRFVTMASHEFRTPLTAMLSSVELIEKYQLADQQENRVKHLNRLRASIKHINTILDEFLATGKLDEGLVRAQAVEVDLPALIQQTVACLQDTAKPNQTIQTELSCPQRIWLDASLLSKLLLNVLSNALKYSGPGSVVNLQGTCQANELTLTLRDEGIGIPQADQKHLFERFFRAHNVTNIAGTGLGLYIVKRYVELMGGQISLTSEVARGTLVVVTLPFTTPPVK